MGRKMYTYDEVTRIAYDLYIYKDMLNNKLLKKIFKPVLLLAIFFAFCSAPCEAGAKTKCKMNFNIKGWSIFYESASGKGSITCDNGQSAAVKIEIKGGGLTAGRYRLRGTGVFSEVPDISELYGSYGKAEVHAGVVKSANAQVVTKGDVSLAIKATGRGVDLGIAFGKFRIDPVGKKSNGR